MDQEPCNSKCVIKLEGVIRRQNTCQAREKPCHNRVLGVINNPIRWVGKKRIHLMYRAAKKSKNKKGKEDMTRSERQASSPVVLYVRLQLNKRGMSGD